MTLPFSAPCAAVAALVFLRLLTQISGQPFVRKEQVPALLDLARIAPPGTLWSGPHIDCSNYTDQLECDKDGNVIVLYLFQAGLNGSLPTSITTLTALADLTLGGNQLAGSIPENITQLTMLSNLDLGMNTLGGTIPEGIGELVLLQALHLDSNHLVGSIPDDITRLTNLTTLFLRINNLTGPIPRGITEVSLLGTINLAHNNLTGLIPPDLGNLQQLGVLNLQDNYFEGPIPESLTGVESLAYLYLQNNQLDGSIPEGLTRLTNITFLSLAHNHLTGEIPSGISSLNLLCSLDFSHNNLSGALPSSIGNMTTLEALYLDHNRLVGGFPQTFSSLVNLLYLDLTRNSLTGGIPTEISKLLQLQLLGLSANNFGGPFPTSVTSLVNLADLDLSYNTFNGTIPAGLANLVSLTSLRLQGNSLSGPIPVPLGGLTALVELNLGYNNLNGEVPEVFQNFPRLALLSLVGNAVTGVLASSLGLLTALSNLEVPGGLRCPIAPCTSPNIGAGRATSAFCRSCTPFCSTCPQLPVQPHQLDPLLQFQEATGIPGFWNSTSDSRKDGLRFSTDGSISAIMLTNFYASGSFNDTLSGLRPTLESLVLPNCNFSGIIPPGIGRLTALTELVLSGNLFQYSPPTTLVHLKKLQKLDLSRQQGPDPMSLSGNPAPGLSGEFPSMLTELTNLRSLDLSFNGFTTGVPEGISQLGNLTSLGLFGSLAYGTVATLPGSLSILPLVTLNVDVGKYSCPKFNGCSRHPVNSLSPFCTVYCPEYCTPCYPPPSPPPPPSPNPPPAPNPPPQPSSGLPTGGVVAIVLGSVFVFVAALLTAFFIWRSRREVDDKVKRRIIRRFTMRQLEEATENWSYWLGRGATGEVFKGTLPNGEDVAVKRSLGMKEYNDEAFRNEVKLMSGIRHRNLIDLHGYCLSAGRLNLVYEFAAHGTLKELLKTDPSLLTWLRRLRIAVGAAKALDYLHSGLKAPILHRDVKSANILISRDLEAKVADFGLSLLASGTKTSKGITGTTGYIDPEVVSTGTFSAKSDVYSFGIVLLELATDWPAVDGFEHILMRVLKACQAGSVKEIMSRDMIPDPSLVKAEAERAMPAIPESDAAKPLISHSKGSAEQNGSGIFTVSSLSSVGSLRGVPASPAAAATTTSMTGKASRAGTTETASGAALSSAAPWSNASMSGSRASWDFVVPVGRGPTVAEFECYLALALRCCAENPAVRPSMAEVQLRLEELLAAAEGDADAAASLSYAIPPPDSFALSSESPSVASGSFNIQISERSF